MNSPPPFPEPRSSTLAVALVLALVTGGWATWQSVRLSQERTIPLDVDGWGHLVTRMQSEGRSASVLFSQPSIWKGPVVPFVFGLSYFFVPVPESVLGLNALLVALTAGLLHYGFTRLGASPWQSAAAILLWIAYPPHAVVYGYYLAEPLLSTLAALTFVFTARALQSPGSQKFFLVGATCGLLLLARAPFAPVVAGLFLLLLIRLPGRRRKVASAWIVGFSLVFLPWTVRNWIVYHEFIPFTTEGGKILFQGVWLPGDDAIMGLDPGLAGSQIPGSIRSNPDFQRFEAGETDLGPVENYRYWQRLAFDEMKKDPGGEARLCIRKAIRFWARLPTDSWIPNWKTTAVAAIALPLALLGAWVGRRRLLEQLCMLFVGGLWLFHTLVHSELRYNYPVLPMLFLLGTFGASSIWNRLARRSREAAVR